MSAYEKYDETSRHYDRTRVAVGGEIILGCLARLDKPLGALAVLDAGCGTGAYSETIVGRVGRVAALDMSSGMLETARAKLRRQEAAGRIAFHRGSIADLPFDDESFDGVMINQVLHHLDDDAGAGYPAHRRVFAEFARVLRPGGGLVVNSCTQEQLRDAYWYYRLIPGAARAMRARMAPLDALRALLADAGLVWRGSFVPADAVCQGTAYFDGRGPLDKAWRDGDSVWALAEEAELAAALARVRAMDAAGELDAFVAEHDARRPRIGQIVFVSAVRTSRDAGGGEK
ncbi:MAG: class I SAM-dependent methyltransferase [Alphaproteobacteria bacterium]